MKRVDILYFEASSGHKSAAEALRYGLEEQYPDWSIRTIDLRDVLRCQTRLLDFIYTNGVNFFNWCMKREKYFFFSTCIRLWIIFARMNTTWASLRFLLRWTADFWRDAPPDAVISVTPMKHTIVYEAARLLNPAVKCITIPVDYREMTPGYWFQPAVPQHYLVGCSRLRREALESGVPASDVTELSGMIIDPRFYDTEPIDRDELLSSMGLDPSLPTGVISFGGQGTVNVLRCANRIVEQRMDVNLICLCGRNADLLESVKKIESKHPVAALGFTAAPPVDVHRVADFLIGKPGTMTLTEALITDTAFVFIKSCGLDIVQGANEDWILENRIGVQADSPEVVDSAIQKVLNNREVSRRITESRHQGVFDAVAEIGKNVESARRDRKVKRRMSETATV